MTTETANWTKTIYPGQGMTEVLPGVWLTEAVIEFRSPATPDEIEPGEWRTLNYSLEIGGSTYMVSGVAVGVELSISGVNIDTDALYTAVDNCVRSHVEDTWQDYFEEARSAVTSHLAGGG